MSSIVDELPKRQLNTKFIGRPLLRYEAVDSTMEVARRLARTGCTEGTSVVADRQTEARGRMGRKWFSPPGSLALSIVLRPSRCDLAQVMMATSLAVLYSIRQVYEVSVEIKWPNDILLNGKKVCGILLESELEGMQLHYVVVGIGVNLNVNPDDLPEASTPAASLYHESRKYVSPEQFLPTVLNETERLYVAIESGVSVYQEWRDNLGTLGKWVRVKVGEEAEEGCAESLDPDGSLCLRRADGSISRITVGDLMLTSRPNCHPGDS